MPGLFQQKISSKTYFPILALIAAGILAFAFQIPHLGLFQDDWHFIHYGSARGAQGMLEFLTMDGRPTAAWVYALGYPLLGFDPLHWQIVALALRLVTVILAWAILNILWPERKQTNLLAAFIFLLYPFFTLQPQAVVYTEHWVSFALFLGSMWLMLQAARNQRSYLLLTALAVLAQTFQLFTVEYFAGLELLRPFALWVMLKNEDGKDLRHGLGGILRTWLPYLLILLLFLYWKTFILGNLGLRNDPSAALTLGSMLNTLQNLPADIALVLFTSWFKMIDPAGLELDRARNLVVLLFTVGGGWLALFFTRHYIYDESEGRPSRTYLMGGILAFLLGLGPAYAGNFIIHLKLEPWNSRFALAALPGAGMILASLFESVITSDRARRLLFSILIGLLIGWHNRIALDFRTSWDKQVNLYQQLVWRAPAIQPGTAIITDQEILGYMGDYPTSFAINTIYDTRSLRPSPYWFFAMSENLKTDPESLQNGTQLKAKKYASTFIGSSHDSLIIVFEPEKDQCLWVLRSGDASFRGLPEQINAAALVSNLDRISEQPLADFSLYSTIVPENRGTWCYYYQHADLARQSEKWETVISFWELAQEDGYLPGHGFEYIPFIQAYAHSGDWETGYLLTKRSYRASPYMKTILCPVLEDLAGTTPSSPEKDSTVNEINDLLGCLIQ